MVSLNGREPQLLIDPNVDLAKEEVSLLPARWILPLTTPLASRNISPDQTKRLQLSAPSGVE
jgi:hypothetical protein